MKKEDGLPKGIIIENAAKKMTVENAIQKQDFVYSGPPIKDLDTARQVYLDALHDKAEKIILKHGIELEEKESKLFDSILK